MTAHLPPTDSPAMRRIVLALEHGDKTIDQIAKVAAVARSTLAKTYMTQLKKQGRVHVVKYRPPNYSGGWTPIYRAGLGVNAKQPPKRTNAETAKKYQDRTGHTKNMQKIARQMAKMNQKLSFAGQFGA